jgi:hypothetical protein
LYEGALQFRIAICENLGVPSSPYFVRKQKCIILRMWIVRDGPPHSNYRKDILDIFTSLRSNTTSTPPKPTSSLILL